MLPPTIGSDAAARWLANLGLHAGRGWFVEIAIDAGANTTFELNVYPEEWGFAFHHAGRTSRIRVTDIPFAHGCDDYALVHATPDRLVIEELVARLETQYGVRLRCANAVVHTNIPGATEAVREWLAKALRPKRRRSVRAA